MITKVSGTVALWTVGCRGKGMLRKIVMLLYGMTGITPDRIITIFVVVGSLIIVELGYLLIKRVIIGRIINKRKRTDEG